MLPSGPKLGVPGAKSNLAPNTRGFCKLSGSSWCAWLAHLPFKPPTSSGGAHSSIQLLSRCTTAPTPSRQASATTLMGRKPASLGMRQHLKQVHCPCRALGSKGQRKPGRSHPAREASRWHSSHQALQRCLLLAGHVTSGQPLSALAARTQSPQAGSTEGRDPHPPAGVAYQGSTLHSTAARSVQLWLAGAQALQYCR